MADRLFQLDQEIQRLKAHAQSGLSVSQAYEYGAQDNRLLAIEQSLMEARGEQAIFDTSTLSLAKSEYSKSFAVKDAWVMHATGKSVGARIHKSISSPFKAIETGLIPKRVPNNQKIRVDLGRTSSNYVWCEYQGVKGYINKKHIFIDTKDADSFIELMFDYPMMFKELYEFASKESATENLSFLRDYKALEEVVSRNPLGSEEIPMQLDEMIEKYIEIYPEGLVGIPSSDKIEINVPDELKVEAKNATTLEAKQDALKECSREIKTLLERDLFPRFLSIFREKMGGLSLSEAKGDQSTNVAYPESLSNAKYSKPFADDSLTYTLVIHANNPMTGAAIHRSLPLPGKAILAGVSDRVPVGEIIGIDRNRVSKDGQYVWCKHETNEGYINISHIFWVRTEIQRERQEELEKVLRSPFLLRHFRDFLIKEFSIENLNFVLAVEAYQELRSSEESGTNLLFSQAWDQIVIPFLRENSPQQVNIGATLNIPVEGIISTYENSIMGIPDAQREPQKDQFIRALDGHWEGLKTEIKNLMATDSFGRFTSSGLSEILRPEALELWATRAAQNAEKIRRALAKQGVL